MWVWIWVLRLRFEATEGWVCWVDDVVRVWTKEKKTLQCIEIRAADVEKGILPLQESPGPELVSQHCT
jgi:hypothetical protein